MATSRRGATTPPAKKKGPSDHILFWPVIILAIAYIVSLIIFVSNSQTEVEGRKIVIAWTTFLAMASALGALIMMIGVSRTGKITHSELLPTALAFLIPGVVLFITALISEKTLFTAMVILQYVVIGLLGIGTVILLANFLEKRQTKRKPGEPEATVKAAVYMGLFTLLFAAIVFMCDPFAAAARAAVPPAPPVTTTPVTPPVTPVTPVTPPVTPPVVIPPVTTVPANPVVTITEEKGLDTDPPVR